MSYLVPLLHVNREAFDRDLDDEERQFDALNLFETNYKRRKDATSLVVINFIHQWWDENTVACPDEKHVCREKLANGELHFHRQRLPCACPSCISGDGSNCENGFLGDFLEDHKELIKVYADVHIEKCLREQKEIQCIMVKDLTEGALIAFVADDEWKSRGYKFYLGQLQSKEFVDKGDSFYNNKRDAAKSYPLGKLIPLNSYALNVRWFLKYDSSVSGSDEGNGIDKSEESAWYYLDEVSAPDWISSESVITPITDGFQISRVIKYAVGAPLIGPGGKKSNKKKKPDKESIVSTSAAPAPPSRKSSRASKASAKKVESEGMDLLDDEMAEENQFRLNQSQVVCIKTFLEAIESNPFYFHELRVSSTYKHL